MSNTIAPSPYHSDLLRQGIGPGLRPGGMALTDRALEVCGFTPGARLLDVGCGAGATVAHLQETMGFRITGLDPSPSLLEEARRRNPGLPLVEGRAENLPWPGDSLDGVLCECVLSLLEEPGRAVAEFRRVLRPGGCLLLSDLYDRGNGGPWADRQALEDLLNTHGFRPLLWEDHTRLLQEMAAQLVLAGESLEAFCGPKGCPAGTSPGYYLLVGRLDELPSKSIGTV